MTPEDGQSDVPAGVKESLCTDTDIEFVAVFGSRVTDTSRPSSDLDIAVKFSETLSADERFQKRCHLAGHLQQSDTPVIDLSDIDDLSLEVTHAAVNGELLCGDEQKFQRFKTEVEAEFEDRQEELEQDQRQLISRIADEGFHG